MEEKSGEIQNKFKKWVLVEKDTDKIVDSFFYKVNAQNMLNELRNTNLTEFLIKEKLYDGKLINTKFHRPIKPYKKRAENL